MRIFKSAVRAIFYGEIFACAAWPISGWIVSGDTTKNSRIEKLDLLTHKGPMKDLNVYDISGGLGYEFKVNWLKFTPLFGYSWSQQTIKTSKLTIERDFMNDIKIGQGDCRL